MPNSFLPAAPILQAGVVILGDAFNMRHPLTGAGMSVALHDVQFWKDAIHRIPDLHDTEAIMKLQRSFHWKRKLSHSFVTNTLAQALYALFAAGDDRKLYTCMLCLPVEYYCCYLVLEVLLLLSST